MKTMALRNSNFICLAMTLLMVISIFLSSASRVYASSVVSGQELSIEEINNVVGESVYYSEETQIFFIDEVSAKWGGLNDIQISNLKEWINFINSDKNMVNASLEYAGYSPSIVKNSKFRALPVFVVIALKALGKGALAAVGAAVATYGMQGACKRIGLKYAPFANFCRANGWTPGISFNGGGGRGF